MLLNKGDSRRFDSVNHPSDHKLQILTTHFILTALKTTDTSWMD